MAALPPGTAPYGAHSTLPNTEEGGFVLMEARSPT